MKGEDRGLLGCEVGILQVSVCFGGCDFGKYWINLVCVRVVLARSVKFCYIL